MADSSLAQAAPGAAKTPSKTILRALAGERVDPAPVWLMRQAGRYLPEYRALRDRAGSFKALCYTPELAVEATLQPLRRFPLDAAILFADLPLILEGLGQPLDYVEGVGPVLEPIRDPRDLARLSTDRAGDHLAPVFETVRRLRAELPPRTALIGFAGAPWTVATYMVEGGSSRDFAMTKRWAFRDPDGFGKLVAMLVQATTAYLSGQIEAGAEVVQLFDSWAGVLPEDAVRSWVIAPTAAIVATLKSRHPHVPVIGFPRGLGLMLEEYAMATGVDALALDSTVPLRAARDLQRHRPVQGNLDPQALVTGGPALTRATEAILASLGSGPLVFNLGHGIVPDTPPDHVAALVEQVHAFRRPGGVGHG